jgi:hypothetical protein
MSAAGIALEVLEKHHQMKGDYPMGMLGVRAAEELREAFRLLYPTDDRELPAAQREWLGLTSDDVERLVEQARQVPADVPCPDYNERLLALADAKLRENNMP